MNTRKILIIVSGILSLAIMITIIIVSPGLLHPATAGSDILTSGERQWLDLRSGKIRLAPCPGWEPMEIFDETGQYSGFVADHIKLIEERLGFQFTLVRVESWAEIVRMARQQMIDVIPAAQPSPETRSFMTWSEPYLEAPAVIITRKGTREKLTLKALEGMRVGSSRSYMVTEYIRKYYPRIDLTLVADDPEGMGMVSTGDLDAVVAEFQTALWTIEREKITNLRVAGITEFSIHLSIGVRKDWPILARIMQKGLDSITESERKIILSRWFNLGEYPSYYYGRTFWYAIVPALVGLSTLAALVFFWNLTLRRKVAGKTLDLTTELAERKRIESALRESESRLATLVGNLPGMAFRHHVKSDGVWPFDYASHGCYDLTGYRSLTEAGLETIYYDKVIHPEDRGRIREKAKSALATHQPFRLVYRIITAAGSEKWVWEQGVGRYRKDGSIICVEGFITDITEYKIAQEALEKSRQLFHHLVINSLVGIAIVQNDRVVYQNPEQKRILGPLPEDFRVSSLAGIHPDDREKVGRVLKPADASEGKALEIDFRLYSYTETGMDIQFKWVHCGAVRIEYQGKPSVLLNMMDVTRTRELEHLVSVQDKMSSLGRVAAGIAHEIRNPLSGINLYIGALERKLNRSGNSEDVSEELKQMKESSHNIESVIRRVMDFAKPGAPRFNTIDIGQPVRAAIDLSLVTLRKNGIQVSFDLNDGPLSCIADRHLIQRVVMNLISNATEAMRHMADNKFLEIRTGLQENRILIQVSDSGPGVALENRERIFDPFFTTKNDGTGIGLSLSQRIVSDHFGAIRVSESRWGGARFTTELPIEKGDFGL